MSLDQNLVLAFFTTFARMEYALKRAGFVREGSHGGAEPAWKRFVKSIEAGWNDVNAPEFLDARHYLLNAPPKQQVLRDDVLDWRDIERTDDESEAEFVVNCVKRIRNNLFHGGKFPIPTGTIDAPERDETLLKHGTAVLHALLQLDEAVREHFHEDS